MCSTAAANNVSSPMEQRVEHHERRQRQQHLLHQRQLDVQAPTVRPIIDCSRMWPTSERAAGSSEQLSSTATNTGFPTGGARFPLRGAERTLEAAAARFRSGLGTTRSILRRLGRDTSWIGHRQQQHHRHEGASRWACALGDITRPSSALRRASLTATLRHRQSRLNNARSARGSFVFA